MEVTRQTNQAGQYLFDFVSPGVYTLTVEREGFRAFVQRNIRVKTRDDVTVNAALELGAVTEAITVEESPVAVSFNRGSMETTVDTKMANDLPIVHRNPFLLATLDPAVNYVGAVETSPYHHWAASMLEVGGNTTPTRRQWTPSRKSRCSRTPLTRSSATRPAGSCPFR